jgi:hypothetical protein
LVESSTSQPFDAMPSQSVKTAVGDVKQAVPQTPAEQVAT